MRDFADLGRNPAHSGFASSDAEYRLARTGYRLRIVHPLSFVFLHCMIAIPSPDIFCYQTAPAFEVFSDLPIRSTNGQAFASRCAIQEGVGSQGQPENIAQLPALGDR